ncbi:hypothetical protein BC936DRAFT_136921, partial [Jimgerdemannia flammicorona]
MGGTRTTDPVALLTEFKEKFRNKVAHNILTGRGRWADHAIQKVAILCEVVALLGGNCDDVSAAREKVEKMIQKSMSISTAAAGVRRGPRLPKRKLEEEKELVNITDFVMEVLEGVERTEKESGAAGDNGECRLDADLEEY